MTKTFQHHLETFLHSYSTQKTLATDYGMRHRANYHSSTTCYCYCFLL